jgi:hypothetical protein
MSQHGASDEQPRRPSPRPRPAAGARPAAARPSPRPRVAGSRREREDDDRPTGSSAVAVAEEQVGGPQPRRGRVLPLLLAVLCLLALTGGGWLLWERSHPGSVDPTLFSAARSGVEALYAYDYQDSEGSVQRKLDVLTGDLQEQYRQDLSSGGIIDTYEQVSATTSYEVAEVGLQQVNESQDQATVVVFGQYVVRSVNSGTQQAPSGSECTVTDDGAQACTQTVQVTLTQVDGDWKISELTLLTTS